MGRSDSPLCVESRLPGKFFGIIPILILLLPTPALAWGDLGHQVVMAIALHYLDPAKRQRLEDLLAGDSDPLTAHDPLSAAIWADRFRDSNRNGRRVNYHHTHAWHFVDLELKHPDLDQACNGHPPLATGTPASEGPAQACVVDKIEQFEAELLRDKKQGFPDADLPEDRLALKYLIHFVADLHQPLHAIDDHDRGGNDKRVRLAGERTASLHHYWDSTFVERLGTDPNQIAQRLVGEITPTNIRSWRRGTPQDWARESFATARDQAYGALPAADDRGHYLLDDHYAAQATAFIELQLEEAGVRLARCLERAL